MTTTDSDALTERIARTLYRSDGAKTWDREGEHFKDLYRMNAAAVLPIIAAEARKAKAEALREAAGDIVWSAETLPHMTPHDAARGLVRRATGYEMEDQT